MIKIFKLGLILAILLILPLQAMAWSLTGTWDGHPDGSYYLRQSGNTLWWYAEQSSFDPGWAHVARGTINGNKLTIEWIDIPKGSNSYKGSSIFTIVSNHEIKKEKDKSGDYFGLISLTR